ncbi:MAG: cell division protein FtsQ/DivIB [Chloroflexota bacterium]
MTSTRRSKQQRKLRRQPRLRRAESSSILSIPRLEIPRTAKRRRRRNKGVLRLPTAALKQVILTSRWISLFLLVVCVAALGLIGTDEDFYLTTIPVEGVSSIPAAEIVEASGLGGAHIFAVHPGDAAASIMSVPGVISATVRLEWPNAAHVSIAEETPVAVWEQGDEQYWVNERGVLVPARVDVPALLHIQSDQPAPSVATTAKLSPSDAEEEEDATEEAAELFVPPDILQGALQLRELRPNIDRLSYSPSGGLSFEDGRGWRVYFGSGTDMDQKLVVYETMVDYLLEQGLSPEYISVSNQEKPFYLANDS